MDVQQLREDAAGGRLSVDKLIDVIAGSEKILPYLDMPIQHGSDRVLKAMRRPERQAVIRERVAGLRDAVADLTLRTTVIVGFPGETDEDFSDMLSFLEEIRFDRVGAFERAALDGEPHRVRRLNLASPRLALFRVAPHGLRGSLCRGRRRTPRQPDSPIH